MSADITAIDGAGITYRSEEGPRQVAWSDVKAMMLATTDHMLESAGSLFSMAERLEAGEPGANPTGRRGRHGGHHA